MWHVAKSVKKKLSKMAKKKSCSVLGEWIKSISGHLWCSATCNEDVELLHEKRSRIIYHVTNQHEFSGNKKYTKCCHPPYSTGKEHTKWL